jgi:hypothetical protein
METILAASIAFEETGIFNYILITIGVCCVVGTAILAKRGSL